MITSVLDPGLERTLTAVAGDLASAKGPWWIIGSAAMRLHGAKVSVADVDVLLAADDAAALLSRWQRERPQPDASDRFRSVIFLREAQRFVVPVELMADLEVNDGGWRKVIPASRLAVPVAGATVYIPSVADLMAMCAAFGRQKDKERAALLAALG